MQLMFFDWSRIITKFTNWTLLVTISNLILTYLCLTSARQNVSYLAATQLTFEFGIIMNITTVALYWTLLHKSQLKKYKGDSIRTFHQYSVHIWPFVGMAINFYVTDVRMVIEHYKGILAMCFAYCFTNFFAVKALGSEPLYWFLDWTDLKSPLICATITASFTMIYLKIA